MNALVNQIVPISKWNPLVMILIGLIVGIVVYLIYRMGNPSYKDTEHKRESFLSSNAPPEESKALHLGGSNLYWGFTQALQRYFKPLVSAHTGVINDYLYWLLITMALVMVVLYFV
ncbi:MAG: hydrogenase [Thermoplasmata archaeon]